VHESTFHFVQCQSIISFIVNNINFSLLLKYERKQRYYVDKHILFRCSILLYSCLNKYQISVQMYAQYNVSVIKKNCILPTLLVFVIFFFEITSPSLYSLNVVASLHNFGYNFVWTFIQYRSDCYRNRSVETWTVVIDVTECELSVFHRTEMTHPTLHELYIHIVIHSVMEDARGHFFIVSLDIFIRQTILKFFLNNS